MESLEWDKNSEKEKEDDDNESYSLWYDTLEMLYKIEPQKESFFRLYQLPEQYGLVKIFENEGGAFVAEGTTGLVTWEVFTI